jgi:hypothetical protein
LTHLPGEIDLEDGIEPPGTDDDTQHWLQSEECSLPPELKTFVATASRHCCFRYRWRPPEQLELIRALCPGRGVLTGGADFCNSCGFMNHDNRQWFEHGFPLLFEEAASTLAGIVPPEFTQLPSRDMMDSLMKSVTDAGRVHGLIALLTLEGGDQISLDCGAGSSARPVVYVPSAEPAKRQILSASFDEFLSDWEHVCYVTPNLENLMTWFDLAGGRLRPNPAKARLLREILTAASVERSSP